MKKLLNGIVDFRKNVRDSYNQKFSRLAAGQTPDLLFIACSDSRVVPNLFASTNPGDLFVIRNVGNLIPPCCNEEHTERSEAAAIDFSVLNLNVKDVVVCGHSECGAMQAILSGRNKIEAKNLKNWLQHGEASLGGLKNFKLSDVEEEHNRLSQLNVLQQVDHLMTYPEVKKRVANGSLRLHAWWFDLKNADVYSFSTNAQKYILIDEDTVQEILVKLT